MRTRPNNVNNLKFPNSYSFSTFSITVFVIPDAIDFHAPVKLGHIIHITGRATFTSAKSMEIEVVVYAKDYHTGAVFSNSFLLF